MRIVKEHDVRRTEILDVAEELFLSKGYSKTTVNDILKIIGIAKGTFYHYFKSKEEVLDAVIMRIVEQDILIAKEILHEKNISAMDKIIDFLITQSTNQSQQKNQFIEQFQNVENALMKQRALEGSIKYVCPVLAEIIEEGNQSEEFQTDFPLEAIQFLIAGIQSLVDERIIEPEEEKVAKRIASFVDIIFRVLAINETRHTKEELTQKFYQIFTN